MSRSLMTISRELYVYLNKFIFMLKHSVKLRRYIYIYRVRQKMYAHFNERKLYVV